MRNLLCTALVAVALTACGGDKATGPNSEAITGSYALKTVDGASLPVVVAQEVNAKLEVTSATLSLNGDNTYSFTVQLRETQGTTISTGSSSEVGTYQRTNNAVAFHPSDNSGDWSAAYATGGTLTAIIEGTTLVFQR